MTSGDARSVDLARVRRVVSLGMVLGRYGLLDAMRPSGAQLKGCCPIHNGSNKGQFVVNLRDNTWRCFGDCNRGGSTLELVAAIEKLELRDAAVRIASWFALSLPHDQPATRRRTMSGNERPSHKVFTVEDKDGDDDKGFWTRIGSAWPHKDGKGINIVLSALPLNGRLVLREFTEEDEREADKGKTQSRRR